MPDDAITRTLPNPVLSFDGGINNLNKTEHHRSNSLSRYWTSRRHPRGRTLRQPKTSILHLIDYNDCLDWINSTQRDIGRPPACRIKLLHFSSALAARRGSRAHPPELLCSRYQPCGAPITTAVRPSNPNHINSLFIFVGQHVSANAKLAMPGLSRSI